jgi:GxxExxY protein
MRKGGIVESNEITSKIIEASIQVHKVLGPGLLESIYHRCLIIELQDMGLKVAAEVPLPVTY